MLIGQLDQQLRHAGKSFLRNTHSAEGVPPVRVKPRRNQNPLGREFFCRGDDDVVKDSKVLCIGATRRQRHVNGVAFPFLDPRLLDGARAGVIRVLMCRKVEHTRIFPEDFLCAIPVMDIPIDDQDSLDTVSHLRITGADCRIVE